jgi:cyclopropane fatty-acyl-phospholipid synthase-like methyltransferase
MSNETEDNFNKLWAEQTEVSWLGKQIFKMDRKKIFDLLRFTSLNKKSAVLDVGCGTGSTLNYIRNLGYSNSIGCDISNSSIKLCQRNGFKKKRDVFLTDISKCAYKKDFDLVFAEGVIEHYTDIQPVVNGLCKASKKYVLTTMPNLKSFYWYMFEAALKIMGRQHAEDFHHTKYEYIKAFENAGFSLVELKTFSFNRGWLMLFKRRIQ